MSVWWWSRTGNGLGRGCHVCGGEYIGKVGNYKLPRRLLDTRRTRLRTRRMTCLQRSQKMLLHTINPFLECLHFHRVSRLVWVLFQPPTWNALVSAGSADRQFLFFTATKGEHSLIAQGKVGNTISGIPRNLSGTLACKPSICPEFFRDMGYFRGI